MKHFLERLLNILLPQIGEYTVDGDVYTGSVEIRILSDNKEMSVGEKRNKLIHMAKGEYFSFIDDADLVSEEYVDQVLRKIRKNPDVVTFWGYRFHNGKKDRRVNYVEKYSPFAIWISLFLFSPTDISLLSLNIRISTEPV